MAAFLRMSHRSWSGRYGGLGEGGALSDEAFAKWQKDVGEPEPGFDAYFRAGVEEALAGESGDIPHEDAMKEFTKRSSGQGRGKPAREACLE